MENNKTVMVELTEEQYSFLEGLQKTHETELGIEVPISALVRKAVDGAMRKAAKPERAERSDRGERSDRPQRDRKPGGFGGGRDRGGRPGGGFGGGRDGGRPGGGFGGGRDGGFRSKPKLPRTVFVSK